MIRRALPNAGRRTEGMQATLQGGARQTRFVRSASGCSQSEKSSRIQRQPCPTKAADVPQDGRARRRAPISAKRALKWSPISVERARKAFLFDDVNRGQRLRRKATGLRVGAAKGRPGSSRPSHPARLNDASDSDSARPGFRDGDQVRHDARSVQSQPNFASPGQSPPESRPRIKT